MKSISKYFSAASALLLVIAALTKPFQAGAQGKNEEVTIIAPYIPAIGNATKIPFRPEVSPEVQQPPVFGYEYVTKKYDTRLETDPVDPMKYSEGEQGQLYRNYARAGFGNYVTPHIDFMATSLRSEKYLVGLRLRHLSSEGKIKNYPPSAYSQNSAAIFAKAFSKNHTFSGDLGYDRNVVHHYGFSPDSFPETDFTRDDLKQRFQHIHGQIGLSSNYRDPYMLSHQISFGVHHYTDFYGTRENQVSFLAGFDKGFDAGNNDFTHAAALDFGLDFIGYKDTLKTSSPFFISLNPAYRFAFGQYRFLIGLNISMAGTKVNENSSFGMDVFPVLKAEVVVVEDVVKAFAMVTGNRTINTFRSMTGGNPFLISTPDIRYTDEQIKAGGGITGNAGGMNFTADAYYSYFNDMPLYISDTSLPFQNQFRVDYDNMNLLTVRASLGYVKIKDLSARLTAAYFHYIPKNEAHAWQLPEFEAGLDLAYILKEKYTIKATVLTLGKKYAKTYDADGLVVPVKMDGALDLGAGFEYQVNRMVSAYVDVNNILNQHYQRWYRYPVQGILVMAGAKISF